MKAGGKRVESEIPGLHAESFVLDFYGTMFYRGWVFLRVTLKLLVSLRCLQIDATLPDKLITENVVGQDFSGLAQTSNSQGNSQGQEMLDDSYCNGRDVLKD